MRRADTMEKVIRNNTKTSVSFVVLILRLIGTHMLQGTATSRNEKGKTFEIFSANHEFSPFAWC